MTSPPDSRSEHHIIPPPRVLWRSTVRWGWIAYLALALYAVPHFVVQYWFNQSLGFQTLFWTNLGTQAALFIGYGLVLFLAIWLPVRAPGRSADARRASLHLGIWGGTLGGWLLAGQYQQALLFFHGVPFGRVDPVFGLDIGFYVYRLPFWQLLLTGLAVAGAVGLIASVAREPRFRLAPPWAPAGVLMLGLSLTGLTYLSRYTLLYRDNEASGVRTGAEYLDLVGIVSTLNYVSVTTLVVAGLTVLAAAAAFRANRPRLRPTGLDRSGGTVAQGPRGWRGRGRLVAAGALLAVDLAWFLALVIKNHVAVSPNEPVIQQEFIQRHMTATLAGYRLDRVETHDWALPDSALNPDQLLASKTVQNAPVMSPWVSYLEEPPDVRHYERLAISQSTMVYGPLLQIFTQQQQLRPYYRFLSVDGVRYRVDGQQRMYASSVRELPSVALVGAQEWLRYWGSAALLFTHGMGLVMSPANGVDSVGNPEYVVHSIPPEISHPAFRHEPRIYFGEGLKDDYVLTGIRSLQEFDFATDQSRQETIFPPTVGDGIPVNSWFRRLVFALYTGDLTAFLFSRYIDHGRTRVHIRRTPMTRAASLVPFLFLDSNVYAFIADGKVLWMINGLATSNRYPYSYRELLGDKADERAVEPRPERLVNYAEDAVKITLDAYSGEIRFYQVADDPIINTWSRIYPDLFAPGESMPTGVRAQLTYPLQWFHLQFDDIYKRYHQQDPLEFYNLEDLWDDADEILGSMGRGLSGFGTGDQMTFSYEGYQALLDPADLPAELEVGSAGELQFALLMPFTPEGARNLRSLVIAFQDPDNYGRLLSLQIPQGTFVPGPEQVDAYIDNDRPVHQQVTMWIRHGSEVIRGNTLLLPVGGDLIYLETIWVNSLQNDLPQLRLVAVRYRNRITSGTSLEEAIRGQVTTPEPPLPGG